MGFEIENQILKKYTEEPGVTEVVIPDNVLAISNNAFLDCRSLCSIKIPNGVMGIGQGAFSGCSTLTSITLPDTIEEILGFAFSGCESLTTVTIPKYIEEIEWGLFAHCDNLRTIKLYEDDADIIRNYPELGDDQTKEILKGIKMMKTGDYSAKVKPILKYPLIIAKYLRDRDEDTKGFIIKNLSRMMKDSITYGDTSFIAALCESDDFFNKNNIDKFITSAENQPEIQAMLEEYRSKL